MNNFEIGDDLDQTNLSWAGNEDTQAEINGKSVDQPRESSSGTLIQKIQDEKDGTERGEEIDSQTKENNGQQMGNLEEDELNTSNNEIQIQYSKIIPDEEQIQVLDEFLDKVIMARTAAQKKKIVEKTSDEEMGKLKATITQIIWNDPKSGRSFNQELIQKINQLIDIMKWGWKLSEISNTPSADNLTLCGEDMNPNQSKIQDEQIKELEKFLELIFSEKEKNKIKEAIKTVDLQERERYYKTMVESKKDGNNQLPKNVIAKIKRLEKIPGWVKLGETKIIKNEDIQKMERFLDIVFKNNAEAAIQSEILKFKEEIIEDIKEIISEILYPSLINANWVHDPKMMANINKLIKITKWTIQKRATKRKIHGKESTENQKRKKASDEAEINNDETPTFEKNTETTSTESNLVKSNDKNDTIYKNNQTIMITRGQIVTPELSQNESLSISLKEGQGSDEKDKRDKFYIEKARYIRPAETMSNDHIKRWHYETPRGFGLFIKGPSYTSKTMDDILQTTTETFGPIKNIYMDDKYTLVVMHNEKDREKMKGIIEQKEGLIVESAKYRLPVIKFSVHKNILERGTEKLVRDLKQWNGLNKFQNEKFALTSIHQIGQTDYMILLFEIHPDIRNYIIETLRGELRLSNKSYPVKS
uniref:DUF4780 domain-containing protein n=1 Tax=Tetranychus urticae TaxID=32264 RepID=T1KSP2_TETUR